jgi:ABC-type sugar transport system substrate-binding protein
VTAGSASPPLTISPISGGISRAKGKSVWWIGDTSIPSFAAQSDAIKTAGTAAGVTIRTFNTNGTTSLDVQGIQEAVAAHANAIIIDGLATELVGQPLEAAATAGIPVVSMYEEPTTANTKAAIKTTVDTDWVSVGKLEGADAIVTTKCDTVTLDPSDSIFSANVQQTQGTGDVYRQVCPDTCKLQSMQYNASSVATTLAPQIVSAIHSDSHVNAVILQDDGFDSYVIPALQAASLQVSLVTAEGQAVGLKALASEPMVKSDIAQPDITYAVWVAFDATLRLLVGQSVPAETTGAPVRLITPAEAKSKADMFPAYQNFEKRFETAWGV